MIYLVMNASSVSLQVINLLPLRRISKVDVWRFDCVPYDICWEIGRDVNKHINSTFVESHLKSYSELLGNWSNNFLGAIFETKSPDGQCQTLSIVFTKLSGLTFSLRQIWSPYILVVIVEVSSDTYFLFYTQSKQMTTNTMTTILA